MRHGRSQNGSQALESRSPLHAHGRRDKKRAPSMVNSEHLADETAGRAGARAQNFAELERVLFSRAYDKAQRRRHEWWCLWRLLCQSKMRFKIKFPAKIEKRDPPDFLILHGAQKSEVEVTKATFERYEQIKRRFNEMKGKAFLELDPSLFSNRVLKATDGSEAWRQYVREPGEALIGSGSGESEPEQSLATAIKSALARKVAASHVTCPGAKAWLFVDAGDHYPDVHIQEVCELIQSDLRLALERFDVVSVDFGGDEIRLWDRRSS